MDALSNRDMAAIVGRWSALCAHPIAAWRVLPPSKRLVVVTTYFGAAYLTALAALFLL